MEFDNKNFYAMRIKKSSSLPQIFFDSIFTTKLFSYFCRSINEEGFD